MFDGEIHPVRLVQNRSIADQSAFQIKKKKKKKKMI
jgi:hypothetical protein